MNTSVPANVSPGLLSKNDRILPEVQLVSAVIVAVLIAAGIILYFFPSKTAELFAWPINPPLTAMFMGAGYGAGAFFFARGLLGKRWHQYGAYFPGISLFTLLMGISTILHWDKFTHTHISFFAWTFLYFTTPILVPIMWLRNRRTDSGAPDAKDVSIPGLVRIASRLAGVGMLAFSLFMFAFPQVVITFWPWSLTPLTARAAAAFMSAPGLTLIVLARDSRWSAWRVLVEHQLLAAALLLLAVVRDWASVDPANWIIWVFIIAMSGLIVGFIVLYFVMENKLKSS